MFQYLLQNFIHVWISSLDIHPCLNILRSSPIQWFPIMTWHDWNQTNPLSCSSLHMRSHLCTSHINASHIFTFISWEEIVVIEVIRRSHVALTMQFQMFRCLLQHFILVLIDYAIPDVPISSPELHPCLNISSWHSSMFEYDWNTYATLISMPLTYLHMTLTSIPWPFFRLTSLSMVVNSCQSMVGSDWQWHLITFIR